MSTWDAKGKTVLVTGGASGLGAEYVRVFLENGAKNVAILDIAEEVGKATAERLNKIHGDKAVFIKCDVSKEDDITMAFDFVLALYKKIDVIVNNAGIMNDSPNVWRTACDVNWQGLVSFTIKGVFHMRKDEGGAGGTIINISSTAALTPFQALPIYKGAKAAVLHFSQSLSMEPFFENTGVRILTMCFGPTDTPLLHNLETRSYDRALGKMLSAVCEDDSVVFQKVDSAVAAFMAMFETGKPATIWLSVDNKPVQDITQAINKAHKDIENVAFPTSN